MHITTLYVTISRLAN